MLAKTAPSNFWTQNTVLVQLLSLSPMLAISQTAIKGITIAVCISSVAILATMTNRLLHSHIRPSLHFIWILFLVGSITSALELFLQILFLPLHRELGIYVPLISCNLALLIHLEHQYQLGSKAAYSLLLTRSVAMAAGLISAMGVFAGLRELLVFGTLFRDLDLLTSSVGIPLDLASHSRDNQVFSFGLLQPGAFIMLALAIALQRWIGQRFVKPRSKQPQAVERITRARVTGKL